MAIIESPPQLRSLAVIHPSLDRRYDGTPIYERLALPYVYHVVSFHGCGQGAYVYPGIGGIGLLTWCSNKRLKSFDDEVYLLPTDYERNGLVCTTHAYDRKAFKKVDVLVNFVLGLWYGAQHNITDEAADIMGHRTLEEILTVNRAQLWRKSGYQAWPHYRGSGTLREAIQLNYKQFGPVTVDNLKLQKTAKLKSIEL
jgi:hypothetical protein